MEDLIITGVIAAIISAGTAILVVLLGDLLSGSKIFKKLEKHDESSGLCHQKLSLEHMELKNSANIILQLNQKIESKIETIDRTLFTEKEIKKNQIDNLSDKQKEMKGSLDKIVGFADEWERVSYQNARLRSENEELQQENKVLRAQNRKLREQINDLEQDNEYER